jgi:exodeoxyribonuclease VII large subunit/exodeoxyribonuclease VII small subunit
VWRIPARDDDDPPAAPEVFACSRALQGSGNEGLSLFGANGIAERDGALYVSVTFGPMEATGPSSVIYRIPKSSPAAMVPVYTYHPALVAPGVAVPPIADGLRIRCRVSVDFYPPGGRLQVQIREIDPTFTLGDLARRRAETLAALAEAGLMERNKALELPPLPFSIALVTSVGSAAYHDFLATLAESGYGFRVLAVHSAVQGAEAERSLPGALALAAASACDCVVLIRGGGAKSDLAVFDSQAVAEAVARATKPVLTGLGHEIDEAVADLVAWRSFKTPTKVAEELVARIANAETAVVRLRDQLARQARLTVAEAEGRLARAERRAVAARTRLTQVGLRLATLAEGLRRVARHRLRVAEQQVALQRTGAHAAPRIQHHPRRQRRGLARPGGGRRRSRDPHRPRRGANLEPRRNRRPERFRRVAGQGEAMSPKKSEGAAPSEVAPGSGSAGEPGFTAAMRELESILQRIEGDDLDIDRLAEELRRATALLELCRGKIRRAEVEARTGLARSHR